MDAEYLKMVIDNMRTPNERAYQACVRVLTEQAALPGMANYPGMQEGYDLAKALGEAVKGVVWEYARAEHGITDQETNLTGSLFSAMLGHISDADLGAAYYVSVRERWCYANDIDPYPAA